MGSKETGKKVVGVDLGLDSLVPAESCCYSGDSKEGSKNDLHKMCVFAYGFKHVNLKCSKQCL